MIGCESYSVPDYVREHVDLIKPTVHFVHRIPDDPAPLRKRAFENLGAPSTTNGPKTNGVTVLGSDLLALKNCDKFTTPDCLRALYQIDYKPKVPSSNSFGIGVFSVDRPFCLSLIPFSRVYPTGISSQRFRPVLRVSIIYFIFILFLFYFIFYTDPVLIFHLAISPRSKCGRGPYSFLLTEVGCPEGLQYSLGQSSNAGTPQTENQSFGFNGESDLDLEYAMALVNPMNVTLLQTGDDVEGLDSRNATEIFG
jgi:hypothetical protein